MSDLSPLSLSLDLSSWVCQIPYRRWNLLFRELLKSRNWGGGRNSGYMSWSLCLCLICKAVLLLNVTHDSQSKDFHFTIFRKKLYNVLWELERCVCLAACSGVEDLRFTSFSNRLQFYLFSSFYPCFQKSLVLFILKLLLIVEYQFALLSV